MAVDADVASSWPLRLGHAQLRALVDRCSLRVAAGSPVAGMLDAPGPVPDADATLAGDERVRVALRVLCSPRQILFVRVADGDTESVALLLHREGTLVRVDAGSEGVLLSEPQDAGAVADGLCALVDAHDGSEGPALFASRRFLDVVRALADASRPGDDWTTRASLEDAIRSQLAHPERADDVLRALDADGAFEADDGRARVAPAWLSRHAPLLAETSLRVVAHEREDLARGVRRPRALAVVEADPRRVVVLPATTGDADSDTVLAFERLTPDAVRRGLASVLGPPAAPPTWPVVTTGTRPAAKPIAADGDWHAGFWERLLAEATTGAGLPDALTSPRATLEVLADAGATAPHVVAFGRADIVEWTLCGSSVRWRCVGASDAAARVPELLSGGGTSGEGWIGVRARSAIDGVVRGTEMLLGRSGGSLWRLDVGDRRRDATPTSMESILDELWDVLLAPEIARRHEPDDQRRGQDADR